jgi:hypothetical protein
MSVQQIADKYANYWSDINLFYQNNFGLTLNLSHVYVEDGSSFSETLDGNLLLEQFTEGLRNGIFDVPSGACIYHLITGRNPYGVGGIAYISAACNGFGATGFSVDGQGDDEPASIIGFAIHVRSPLPWRGVRTLKTTITDLAHNSYSLQTGNRSQPRWQPSRCLPRLCWLHVLDQRGPRRPPHPPPDFHQPLYALASSPAFSLIRLLTRRVCVCV